MKYFLAHALISLLLCAQSAAAQSAGHSRPTPTLNHIALHVHELKRSTAFYEGVLMLEKIDEPFKDGKHTWFSLAGAGQLHLIEAPDAAMKRSKYNHLCFSVPSMEAFIANLEKHRIQYTNWPGTSKSPTVRPDGVKQIYIQDPDGHWIEINDDVNPK